MNDTMVSPNPMITLTMIKTVTHAYDPQAPLRLPDSVLRRLLTGIALALALLFILWSAVGSMAQPAPAPSGTSNDWQPYQADAFAFSYPAGWTVRKLEGQATHHLAPDAEAGGTHVAIAAVPAASADLGQIERMGVAYIEHNDAVVRHYLRIMPRTRMAGRAAARVRFTADLASGERIEGIWVGVPGPEGQVFSFVLNVYPDAYFNGVRHTFKRLLASVLLDH